MPDETNVQNADSKSDPKRTRGDFHHSRLEEAALELFKDASRNLTRGYNTESVALECFRRATAFLKVSAGIRAGELSAEPEAPLETEYVEVPVMLQSGDEKWKPVKDPVTGKPVTQRLPVDNFAFAPNLPEDHPINLRFKPLDGVSLKERLEKAEAAKAAANP